MVNLQQVSSAYTLASSHIPRSASSNFAVPIVRVCDFANIINKWNNFVRYSIYCI